MATVCNDKTYAVDKFAGVQPLRELLPKLRHRRGFTQAQLAAAAGWDIEAVRRIEQGRKPPVSRRVALAIFEALAKHTPMTAEQAHDFRVQARISDSIGGRLETSEYLALVHKGFVHEPSAELAAAASAPPPPANGATDTDALYQRALERLGPERVESALRAILAVDLSTVTPEEPPAPAPTLKHIGTPVRRPDGHIEQVITEFAPSPGPKHAPPKSTTIKRRTKGA